MVRKNVKRAPCTFLPSLKPTENPWETLSRSLSSLFLRNHSVKWREVYQGSSARFLTSFPKYSLSTSQYYIRFQEQYNKSESRDGIGKPSFEFLGPIEPTVSERLTSFQSNMAPLAPYIKAHSVAGIPLCPASVLMEVVFEALSVSKGPSSTSLHLVEDIIFEKPLVYEDRAGNESNLQTDLDMNVGEKTRFSLSSNDQVHCHGLITHKSPDAVVDVFTRKSALVKRQRRTLYEDLGGAFDSFSPNTIYQVIFPRVVAYDKPFLTLKQLSVSESRLEGSGTFQLDSSMLQDGFVCHPAFIDTLLHAPGFIANIYVPADVACICVAIERAYLPNSQHLLEGGDMTIYCSLTDLGHSVIADAYVINSEDKVVAFIEGACFKKIPLKSFTQHLSRSLRAPAHKPAPITSPTPPPKAVDPPTPNFEETIHSIVQECCGVSLDLSKDVRLVEAGIDSLLFIEITRSIRDRLPHVKIDETSLESCSTLRDLVGVVSQACPRKPLPDTPATEMHSNDSLKTKEVARPLTSTPNRAEGLSPLKNLLLEICGIPIEPGTMDLPLGTLGVDSLLSIELSDELRDRFGFIIDESHPRISELTFTQLEEIVTGSNYQSNDASISPSSQASTGPSSVDTVPSPEPATLSLEDDYGLQRTIQQQSDGPHQCTLYLFHDGSGHCSMYSRMSSINRNITGILSPDPSAEIQHLEDLASLYIKQTNLDNEKEVVLGGKLAIIPSV